MLWYCHRQPVGTRRCSPSARVNGPLFLLGWVLALAIIQCCRLRPRRSGRVATSTAASETVAWGKIVFGVVFLLLGVRQWRSRPEPGTEPEMPKWMAGIDAFSPVKALVLGLLLVGVNLLLTLAAAVGLAQLGLSTTDAVVSLLVFVVVASLAIAGPVIDYVVGGAHAKAELNSLKGWLAVHNAAVMAVLFVVVGVDLIAKGIPPLSG